MVAGPTHLSIRTGRESGIEMKRIEKKYPRLVPVARLLTVTELKRGIRYYEEGGKHYAFLWKDPDRGS